MKIAAATFALVFLRAMQQQNVIHGHYFGAALTSIALAVADVALLLWVVDTGWPAVPYVATGGAAGVVLAMFIHRSYITRP